MLVALSLWYADGGDPMRHKEQWNLIAAACILVLFVVTIFIPSFEPLAKTIALLLYALVSIVSLQKQKKERGRGYSKSSYVSLAVFLILGYLLFFV